MDMKMKFIRLCLYQTQKKKANKCLFIFLFALQQESGRDLLYCTVYISTYLLNPHQDKWRNSFHRIPENHKTSAVTRQHRTVETLIPDAFFAVLCVSTSLAIAKGMSFRPRNPAACPQERLMNVQHKTSCAIQACNAIQIDLAEVKVSLDISIFCTTNCFL